MLVLGGAAVHRFSHRRCAAGRDLLVSGVSAHGQRSGARPALRHVRLENRRELVEPWVFDIPSVSKAAARLGWDARFAQGWQHVRDIVLKVAP
ncbi:hypothetical protein THICB1_60001 [Thiomonas arsenitoxydans]|uniref:GDP-mannose 4,6-dehydratase n=1 Tax=Thiomonas arsenitoxydans (strain DSM 22701 / CIP 110005 / 3As) TaxID=426114 RepID=A0ABM9T7S2_THIA3|nr:hypothetical protein THICB1_60001 [Thiomonas arsenitoxydans]